MNAKKKLVNGISYLITMDEERRIIKDAAIEIEGESITAVGKEKDFGENEYSLVIDAGGMVCLPGLINAHFHPMQQLARGLADNVPSPTWLHDRIFPFEGEMKAEDVYWSYMLAILELIKTGTTCFADPGGYYMDQGVSAIKKLGIRSVVSRSIIDIHSSSRPLPESFKESTEEAVAKGEEFVKRYHGDADGRIKGSFSLRSDRAISSKACRMVAELAEKYKVSIQSHLSSHIDGVKRHKEIFDGMRPIERFAKVGVLNKYLIASHMNKMTDEEVELIRKNDVKIVHNPSAGFAGAYGTLLGKHPEMVKKGVTVAIGSDAAPVSHFNDMFRVMNMLGGHRDVREDPSLFTPEIMLEMCLINGAKALLWDNEIGSIECRKKADFILLDTHRLEFMPLHNPLSNIVYAINGDSVDTVMINGKLVMKGRKLLTYDEEEIILNANRASKRLAQKSGLDKIAVPKWPVI